MRVDAALRSFFFLNIHGFSFPGQEAFSSVTYCKGFDDGLCILTARIAFPVKTRVLASATSKSWEVDTLSERRSQSRRGMFTSRNGKRTRGVF